MALSKVKEGISNDISTPLTTSKVWLRIIAR
jgi:hypothetical protein